MQIQNHALVLVAGTVLLTDPQISPSQRQAAIDSTLYAQLVANKRAGNRFTEPATCRPPSSIATMIAPR